MLVTQTHFSHMCSSQHKNSYIDTTLGDFKISAKNQLKFSGIGNKFNTWAYNCVRHFNLTMGNNFFRKNMLSLNHHKLFVFSKSIEDHNKSFSRMKMAEHPTQTTGLVNIYSLK